MKTGAKILLVLAACFVGALIVSAQSQPRVFLMFTASVEPGHMAEYSKLIETQFLPALEKNEAEVVGAWVSGYGGKTNEMVLIYAFRDYAHLEKATSTPDIAKLMPQFESIRVGSTRTLIPTSFSPLQ